MKAGGGGWGGWFLQGANTYTSSIVAACTANVDALCSQLGGQAVSQHCPAPALTDRLMHADAILCAHCLPSMVFPGLLLLIRMHE